MELTDSANQTLRKLNEQGSLRSHEISESVLEELNANGMVTLERHADFNVVVITEDGKLTAEGKDAPEPDVSRG